MNNDTRIANGVEYRRDWDCDGHIRIINAKTIDRYYQLAYKNNHPVGIYNMFKHFDAINELIKTECNPQEVYFFEYNNHECMYSYEGDEPAIQLIIDYWGADVARTIVRIDGATPIDELINMA